MLACLSVTLCILLTTPVLQSIPPVGNTTFFSFSMTWSWIFQSDNIFLSVISSSEPTAASPRFPDESGIEVEWTGLAAREDRSVEELGCFRSDLGPQMTKTIFLIAASMEVELLLCVLLSGLDETSNPASMA